MNCMALFFIILVIINSFFAGFNLALGSKIGFFSGLIGGIAGFCWLIGRVVICQ